MSFIAVLAWLGWLGWDVHMMWGSYMHDVVSSRFPWPANQPCTVAQRVIRAEDDVSVGSTDRPTRLSV